MTIKVVAFVFLASVKLQHSQHAPTADFLGFLVGDIATKFEEIIMASQTLEGIKFLGENSQGFGLGSRMSGGLRNFSTVTFTSKLQEGVEISW
mgnify:CR=1 FL=1